MEKKKAPMSLTGLIVLIIFLAAVVGGLVYFFTNYDLQIMSKKESQEIVEMEKEEVEVSKIEELDKDSKLAKELYSTVLKYNNYDICNIDEESLENIKFSFYRDDKITYKDLSDVEKILSVLNSTKDEDYIEKVNIENLNLNLYQTEYKKYDIIRQETRIGDKYSNISNTLKRIFGNNAKVENKNYGLLAGIVEYYDDSYYLYSIDGGGLGETVFAYSEIERVEKFEDYIYIYDKYICEDTLEAAMDMNGKNKFYTTADKTKQIEVDETLFKRGEYDYSETRIGYMGIDKSLEKIFKYYEDELNTYKHTFKKAEDGSYYWVSSEIYEVAEDKEEINLKLGKFSPKVAQNFDPSEGEGIASIELKESKEFQINGSYGGVTYTGTFELVDNKLICSATQKTIEEGGYNEKNVNDVFEFVIISETEVIFEKCKNDSKIFELSKNVGYIN